MLEVCQRKPTDEVKNPHSCQRERPRRHSCFFPPGAWHQHRRRSDLANRRRRIAYRLPSGTRPQETNRIVVDASALLAVLNQEAGAERLTPELLSAAASSTVKWP